MSDRLDSDLASLRRAIVRMERTFSLHLVHASMSVRDALSEVLSDDPTLPLFMVAPLGAQCASFIRDLLRSTFEPLDGVIIADVDALLLDDGLDALDALNLARDRLHQLVRGPMILVVSPENDQRLRIAAPDLVSVLATSSALSGEAATTLIDTIARDGWRQTHTDVDALERRLEHAEHRATPGALAFGWSEVALLLLNRVAAEPAIALRVNTAIKNARRFATPLRFERVLALCDLAVEQLAMATGERAPRRDRVGAALAVLDRVGSVIDQSSAALTLANILLRTDEVGSREVVIERLLPRLRDARVSEGFAQMLERAVASALVTDSAFAALGVMNRCWSGDEPWMSEVDRARLQGVRAQLRFQAGDVEGAVQDVDEALLAARRYGERFEANLSLLAARLHLSRGAAADRQLAGVLSSRFDELVARNGLPLVEDQQRQRAWIRARLEKPAKLPRVKR
jgi:hypothetical protein